MSDFATSLHRGKERMRHSSSKQTSTNAFPSCATLVTGEMYYTDEVIRDKLLNDIAGIDIRKEALLAKNRSRTRR